MNTGHYTGLALGYLVLVVYGSLVPLDFQPLPLEEALHRFHDLPGVRLRGSSRSDWAANLALFVPLTYLTMGAFCVDRRQRTVWAAALVIPAGIGLALAIEFAQLFFPPRTSSRNDATAESISAVIGVAAWTIGGQRLTEWIRTRWAAREKRNLAVMLWPAYLLVLVLIHALPLDLTISPVEVYHKYRAGRIRLVPFAVGPEGTYEMILKGGWNVVYFLPGGLLLALLRRPRPSDGQRWPRVLVLGLALAASLQLLKLFVLSRYVDTTDILTGGGAFLAGWVVGTAAWEGSGVGGQRSGSRRAGSVSDRSEERQARADTLAAPRRRARAFWGLGLRAVLLLIWLVIAISITWRPFNFTTDREMVAARIRGASLLPFADYYQAPDYSVFNEVPQKLLLYLPLGALLAPAWQRRTLAGGATLLAAVCFAGVLELGQFLLPSRYPSLTDVLVETFGAGLGFVFASRIRPLLWIPERVEESTRELCR